MFVPTNHNRNALFTVKLSVLKNPPLRTHDFILLILLAGAGVILPKSDFTAPGFGKGEKGT